MAEKPTYEQLEQRIKELEKEAENRKLAEEELKESEEKFRIIADQSLFGVSILQEGKYIYMNDAACNITGFSHAEVVQWEPKDFLKLIHPDDIPTVMIEVKKKLEDGSAEVSHYYYRLYDKYGELKWIENYSKAIEYKGKPADLIIFANVTDRKQVEEALRESEQKYRLLTDSINDNIWILDLDTLSFSYVSSSVVGITGYSAEEATGFQIQDVLTPSSLELATKILSEELIEESRNPNPSKSRTLELEQYHKDGTTVWTEVSMRFIRDSEERPISILGVTRDISERKRLQGQLQQSQKMESLGLMAGGIAHNFNNVLMGIQGRTFLMMIDKDASHPDFDHLKGIEEYVQNAAELTKDLLGFARGGKYEIRPTNLNELIKRENRMFGQTKKEIGIHGKYDKRLWIVEVDQGQLRQALLNLYVNAWQAMPGGGDLYIQTENVTLDENYIKPFEITPGRYIKISVTDTGVGMDKKIREKIFDPFFTTQETGTGSGLGLASVYGIVKNHGGFVDVFSEKGEGTTFNIYLPASEKEVIEEKKPPRELVKGEGTILLVDDEEMITDVGEQLLEKLGYRVLVAKSGREAITLYEKNKAGIDMVILDMIMPGMSGGETYDRLKEIDPDIKALLSSGYSIDGQAQEILDRGCNGFMQKPFNMKEISQKIRETLD